MEFRTCISLSFMGLYGKVATEPWCSAPILSKNPASLKALGRFSTPEGLSPKIDGASTIDIFSIRSFFGGEGGIPFDFTQGKLLIPPTHSTSTIPEPTS